MAEPLEKTSLGRTHLKDAYNYGPHSPGLLVGEAISTAYCFYYVTTQQISITEKVYSSC